MAKVAYDYYRVDVPEDLGDEEQRGDLAIMEARERARLYCLPCDWAITRIVGDMVTVRRRRNR